ncbi:MAG: metal-dependent transcriptional regulator [Nitrospirae bacterium]|uniref:Iron-dependent repressor n=1 Tax=uncultured Nitrospirota bacterium TaxID=170969 RepID=A0A142BTT0_9BACT|nr:iron-dependent repressor [uncultured Nitrospirota bacterium]MBF0328624.1 metal-dependent transcriptional regulator [Nitrospirota bacterium]
MKSRLEKDEYLEALWCMQEDGKTSMADMKCELEKDLDSEALDMLVDEDMAKFSADKSGIALTEKGAAHARRIIRAHRLAERLMYDAMGMGMDFEKGACEFEHIISDVLVNSICIMLGHPKECPHGLPIPPGDCCINSVTTIESAVTPLSDMKIGQSARIAYMNCGEDHEMHRLNGLQIRPGSTIKLHQTYPSFVVECEGSNIAIDEEIAHHICVWQLGATKAPSHTVEVEAPKKQGILNKLFKK